MTVQRSLQKFRSLIAQPENESIVRWRKEGRPVIGHFCSYVPRELLTALGLLPLRLRGAGSTDSGAADVYLSSKTCTYVRHTLSLALEGHYAFLDGEIALNTCDHVRRSFDLWRHKTPVAFHGFLSVPRNARESLYPYYREEIDRLLLALEEHFGCSLQPEALRQAIALHNQVRQRLQQLDEQRAWPHPTLSGAEMALVAVAAQVMAPEDFLPEADRLLDHLGKDEPSLPTPRARLLLLGGELDEPDFIAAIESQGAQIAADLLCFGARPHLQLLDPHQNDPLDALCRHTFFQTSCARMIGNFPQRYDHLSQLVQQRHLDGILLQRLKFCDPWGGEAHNLRQRLKNTNLPLLVLEREYGLVHAGQVRTRVQAFLEMIESASRREQRSGSLSQEKR